MKRNILDITKKLYRSNNRIRLDAYDLTDSIYYIFKKDGYTVPNVLYEMSEIDSKQRVKVIVNNVFIPNDDFEIESQNGFVKVKLFKNRFSYELDDEDVVILETSVE
jgi:hypothetical protein